MNTNHEPRPFHLLAGSIVAGRDVLIHEGIPSLVVEKSPTSRLGALGNVTLVLEDGRTVETYTDRTMAIV
jgi:hypothetical protein